MKFDLVNTANESANFSEWTVNLLIDHIVWHYHRYVRAYVPFMQKYLAKMLLVHGGSNPEIEHLDTLFSKLGGIVNHEYGQRGTPAVSIQKEIRGLC